MEHASVSRSPEAAPTTINQSGDCSPNIISSGSGSVTVQISGSCHGVDPRIAQRLTETLQQFLGQLPKLTADQRTINNLNDLVAKKDGSLEAKVQQMEIEALIEFYNDHAKDIERQMDQTVEAWRQTGPTNPSHPGWQTSIALLERKRGRFKELHQRHIEALRAGHLTLAQVYANETNELLLGQRISYASPPGFEEFQSEYRSDLDIDSFDMVSFEPAELDQIMTDPSQPVASRLSAAKTIALRCDSTEAPSEACVRGFTALFEFQQSYYMLWEYAQAGLCRAEKAKSAVPSLVKVLSKRDIYQDWRSWIFAMEAIGCIGPSAAEAIPHIVNILKNPKPNPDKYYNVDLIQVVGAKTLAKLGKSATHALPTLRKLAKSPEPEVKNAAISAIREIQQK